MELTRHCSLCENEITSLKKGVTCGLTKKKPDFIKNCKEIKLNEKFQQKLVTTILELERICKFKKNQYLIFFILLVVGILIIMVNKVYAEFFPNSPYYWVRRVGVIAVGITVLMGAFFRLRVFKNKLKTAKLT